MLEEETPQQKPETNWFSNSSQKGLDIGSISNYIMRMKTQHIISLISKIRDKANRLIVNELRLRNISGLAPSHGDILNLLFHSENESMMGIAKRIGRNKATVTALVKKLKNVGYVETKRDPDDNRSTLVRLTKKGWGLKQDFEEISQVLLKTAYKDFSDQEKEVIVQGLEKINNNL